MSECRICLEDNDTSDDPLIAPCYCSGSAKFVHRSCLDQWRASQGGLSFIRCEVCHFEYVTELHEPRPSLSQRLKFMALVSRDAVLALLAVQVCIVLLGWFVHALDQPDEELRYKVFPEFIAKHHKTTYYMCGLVLLLAIVGFAGTIAYCCCGWRGDEEPAPRVRPVRRRPVSSSERCFDCCCDACCRDTHVCVQCDCRGCDGGGGGDCRGCDGDGALFAVVAVVLAFALIGLFMGIFACVSFLTRTVQRHVRVLWLRGEAERFCVVDFNGRQLPPRPQRAAYDPDPRGRGAAAARRPRGDSSADEEDAFIPPPKRPSAPLMTAQDRDEIEMEDLDLDADFDRLEVGGHAPSAPSYPEGLF